MDHDERLTRFFAGGGDDDGRSFDEILGWEDARLEMVHDYIQWIFPLPERSGANPWAPVLDAATIATFRGDSEMQGRLHMAFLRMLAFYGFVLEGDAVVEGQRFAVASRNWLHAGNHNHLRLTRMLRSLRVLGLERDAAALWEALRGLYERESAAGRRTITAETFAFWRQAATAPPDR
ncbi:MAG TPA: opioid growth factor receptor-related protein [Acidobacteriaceae bacterium]|nr:opioid growth factor receptor-related protein [Acidobacteriaceae bacterium]